jgi:type II secretory pathway component PulJ
MEPRLMVAYTLMLLMALLLAAFVGYQIYQTRERQYARRLRREARAFARTQLPKRDLPHP